MSHWRGRRPPECAEAKRRETAQTEGRAHERSEVTARGRAENRARIPRPKGAAKRAATRGAFFRQACLVGKVPRSVLGDLVARVAPVSLEVRYLGEAEKRGLTTTLKERPAPPSARAIKAQEKHLLGRRARRNAPKRSGGKVPKARRSRPQGPARGWESQSRSLENRKARTNAAAPKVSPRRRRPEGRTSGGATAIQPPSWDEHRTRSWAREVELERRFEKRTRTQNADAPRLLGQRPCRDEYGDFHRTKPQKARHGGLSTDR